MPQKACFNIDPTTKEYTLNSTVRQPAFIFRKAHIAFVFQRVPYSNLTCKTPLIEFPVITFSHANSKSITGLNNENAPFPP